MAVGNDDRAVLDAAVAPMYAPRHEVDAFEPVLVAGVQVAGKQDRGLELVPDLSGFPDFLGGEAIAIAFQFNRWAGLPILHGSDQLRRYCHGRASPVQVLTDRDVV